MTLIMKFFVLCGLHYLTRIPFQVTTESMKNQNKSRGEKFGFVLFVKHTKDNISDRMKETI